MTLHKGLVRFTSKDHVDGVPYVKKGVNLCFLPNGLRCMGCCGLDFAKDLSENAKVEFIKSLKKSTEELKQYQDKMSFKQRVEPEDLHDCGMCKQLVMEDTEPVEELVKKKHIKTYCPLHPIQNEGKEMRQGECDPKFMCETQKMWHTEWDENLKEMFYDFVKVKDLDWFTYSKKMHNDSLVKEFFDEFGIE